MNFQQHSQSQASSVDDVSTSNVNSFEKQMKSNSLRLHDGLNSENDRTKLADPYYGNLSSSNLASGNVLFNYQKMSYNCENFDHSHIRETPYIPYKHGNSQQLNVYSKPFVPLGEQMKNENAPSGNSEQCGAAAYDNTPNVLDSGAQTRNFNKPSSEFNKYNNYDASSKKLYNKDKRTNKDKKAGMQNSDFSHMQGLNNTQYPNQNGYRNNHRKAYSNSQYYDNSYDSRSHYSRGRNNSSSNSRPNNTNRSNWNNYYPSNDENYYYYEGYSNSKQDSSYNKPNKSYRNNYQENNEYIDPRKFSKNNTSKYEKKSRSHTLRNSAPPGNLFPRQSSNEHNEKSFNIDNRNKTTNNVSEDCSIKPEFNFLFDKNDKTQRETMITYLSKGVYECMVCCEKIKQQHPVWSCNKCFNCFHLSCIKKWAGTSKGEPGWRCPACQSLNPKVPNAYYCFCKKMRDPEWNQREIPHSCGEVCGKKRTHDWCTHKCNILCHPGPCPDCPAYIKKKCFCGKSSKDIRCANADSFSCSEKCSQPLNCTFHSCEKLCHSEPCDPCSVIIEKECYCGKEKKNVECSTESLTEESFTCNSACRKRLSCNVHNCTQICHSGFCAPCQLAVEYVTTCPCGKMLLDHYHKEKGESGRTSCEDPIPLCGQTCGKELKCGTPGNYHTCAVECHSGQCPPCPKQTEVLCRCGFMDKEILCSELHTKADEVTCEKKCKKLRQCGRHKCGQKCCIDVDHICARICNLSLKCRLHKCQEPCHRGNCPRCWETSFEELTCHCGASVLYPPIPCGTNPPSCDMPCMRQRTCSHSASHNCHTEENCPPCTLFVSKVCFGGHTMMKHTPCYLAAMSCGDQCAKKIACGIHVCQRVCHDGPCMKKKGCSQKCSKMRSYCDHPCNLDCHSGPCPKKPCKVTVIVSCTCGNQKIEMACSDNEREYRNMASSRLGSEMNNLSSSCSVDISQMFTASNKSEKLKRLECNDECRKLSRNRQMALALQITNPDARESLGDASSALFSDSVKDEAKKNLVFAEMVHFALNDLVLNVQQSKYRSRSHSFAPMNRDKRRFIHEYSKYFSCESQAYDKEPKKNVVVTAYKAMCRLPPISVVELIKKEQGQRKVPGPVNRKLQTSDESGSRMKRLEKSSSLEKKDEISSKEEKTEEKPIIDYFDFS